MNFRLFVTKFKLSKVLLKSLESFSTQKSDGNWLDSLRISVLSLFPSPNTSFHSLDFHTSNFSSEVPRGDGEDGRECKNCLQQAKMVNFPTLFSR